MNFVPANGETGSDGQLGMSAAIGQRREVLVVLGMHRSGTSLCMSVLGALGVRVDNELLFDVHNPRGYYEATEIVRLNDKLLQSAGMNWHSVLSPTLQGPGHENTEPSALKQRLADFISQKASLDLEPWAMKDPRVCLLLPLYEQLFEQCNLSPAYVLCIRDPRSVALSLKKRDHFPEIFSELLWLNHTLGTMRMARNRIKAVVHYEKWFRDGDRQLRSLAAGLGLPNSHSNPANVALERLIDPALNHGLRGTNGAGEPGKFALSGVEEIYRLVLAEDYEAAIGEFLDIERRLDRGKHRPNGRNGHNIISAERRTIRAPLPAKTDGGGVLVGLDPEELGSLPEGSVVEFELAGLEESISQSGPGCDLAAGLAKGLEASLAEVAQLREGLAEQRNRADSLRNTVLLLNKNIDSLGQKLQAAGAEWTAQEEWRQSVLQSLSWRLTAPIRWIGSLFVG
jgi:hypothetical protein